MKLRKNKKKYPAQMEKELREKMEDLLILLKNH